MLLKSHFQRYLYLMSNVAAAKTIVATIVSVVMMSGWLHAAGAEDLANDEVKTIKVISPIWPNWTNADGTGFYFELIKHIYSDKHTAIHFENATFIRSKAAVKSGESDMLIGIFARSEADSYFITPHMPVDKEEFIILSRQELPTLKSSPSPLRVMIPRGYSVLKRLNFEHEPVAVGDESQGFKMLMADSEKYLLTTRVEAVEFARAAGLSVNDFVVTHLADRYIYLGFTNNTKGQALANIYDRRLVSLINDGTVAELYAKWNKSSAFLTQLPAHFNPTY